MSSETASTSAIALEDLAGVFKALADPTRLRLLGLVVDRERCGQELAHSLRLSPATVSHHLRILKGAGLLRASRERPYTFYRLDTSALQRAVRSMTDRKQVQTFAAEDGRSKAERKVLRTFFDGPRLTAIPAQRRKKEIVFEEILRRLPRRKAYRERELSRWIEAIHPDFCTIRREFIMGRYMVRENGTYFLTDKGRVALGSQGAPARRAGAD